MTLQDLTDKCEAVIFSDGYSKHATALEKAGTLLFVMGRVDRKRSESPQLVVSDALTVDQAMARSLHRIDVRLPPEIQSVAEVQHELQFLRIPESCVRVCSRASFSARGSETLLAAEGTS